MEILCELDHSFIISICALSVAVLTLFITYKAVRHQIIGLLYAQIADKARECNSNLDPSDYSRIPKKNDKISGILSAIITCEELINYEIYVKKSCFLWLIDVNSLVDKFYLQLHTTIREFLKKERIESGDVENENFIGVFNTQFQRSKAFLDVPIKKNECKIFEELHEYTQKRNKNTNSHKKPKA